MEREYTARNGMEEFTTWGLGEQERMASRMRETATAVKNPLVYICKFRYLAYNSLSFVPNYAT